MRVRVDPDRCEGHARCWGICPEVFSLDDEGRATVVRNEVPPELEAKVHDAVRNCPERAIEAS
jgi:ferredoxin